MSEYVVLNTLAELAKAITEGKSIEYRIKGSHGSSVWLPLERKTMSISLVSYDYRTLND